MDSIGASIDSLFPYILIPDKAAFGRRLHRAGRWGQNTAYEPL